MKNLNIRISDEESEALETYCLETGRSKTKLIKLILSKLGTKKMDEALKK